jgi:hypothetical protein
VLAAGLELAAPGEVMPAQAAARSELPLGLGRQPRAAPGTERLSVVPRDVNDRMVAAATEVGLRALRMPPVGPLHLPPPRRIRNPAGLLEVIGKQSAENERPPVALGVGHVPRRFGEGREAIGRNRVRVDLEWGQPNRVHRPFTVARVAVQGIRAHQEAAAFERHHCAQALAALSSSP